MRALAIGVLCVTVCASGSTTGVCHAGQVHLNHVTDAEPQSTMVLAGSGFAPKTVRVVVWAPGVRRSQRDQIKPEVDALLPEYAGRPAEPPTSPPKGARTLTPYHATRTSVFCKLPYGLDKPMPPGYLAVVWLKDGASLSKPWVVNQPRLWFLLHEKVMPGQVNRAYGVSLKGDVYFPNRLFIRNVQTRQVVEPQRVRRHHEDGVEPYHVVPFRVPADLPEGRYEVFVHNNSGRRFGFTEALPMQVGGVPAFPQRTLDVTQRGAKGNSLANATRAIQGALDKCKTAGGGIVFLPAGSYRINQTLEVPEHTILRGAGKHATTLFFQPYGSESGRQPLWMISCRGRNHTGIEDLTLRAHPKVPLAVSYYHGGKPTRDNHVLRCRIEGMLSAHYEVSFHLGECDFVGVCHFTNMVRGWIHDCRFTSGRLRGNPVAIWGSEFCTIENCRVYESSRGFVWQLHGALSHYRNYIDANVVEDTRFGGNAGETFLFEGAGFIWNGPVAGASPNGLVARGVGWKPKALVGRFAVVVSGRGLGQYRRIASNDATSVTVAEPWRTTPAPGDSVTIMSGVVENVLANNRDVNCDNSMMFFGCGALGNRIVRYRSENGLGLTFWPYMADPQKKGAAPVFVPDYFNIVQNCAFEDQGAIWFHTMGTAEPGKDDPRVLALNQIVRNTLLVETARKRENQYWPVWESEHHYRPVQAAIMFREGWRVKRETGRPFYYDCLLEKNFIARTSRGVEITSRASGTVLCDNVWFDVREPVLDKGLGTHQAGNRIEYHKPQRQQGPGK